MKDKILFINRNFLNNIYISNEEIPGKVKYLDKKGNHYKENYSMNLVEILTRLPEVLE